MTKRLNDRLKNDRTLMLMGGMTGDVDGMAESIERSHGAAMRNSTQLPADMQRHRESFEAVGFVFGEPVDGDPIFLEVTMPEGWAKKPTDHPMWSDLVDGEGRRRGAVFYKGSFWDRSAHMHLVRRYVCRTEYGEGDDQQVCVLDFGQGGERVRLYESEVLTRPEDRSRKFYDRVEAEREKAKAWMVERFPEHDDVTAYWGVEGGAQ